MPELTLYHNPRCSKSRAALSLLEERGLQPNIIRYLDTPPTRAELVSLLQKLQLPARQLLRRGEDEYQMLGLDNPDLSEEQLIDAMLQAPKLMERPVLVVDGRAVIGRPTERLLEILP
jgi:arsenate reductase